MIVIPLQMWRFGFERDQYNLGTLVIYNDGTSRDAKRGNYVCRVYGENVDFRDPANKPLRKGTVTDWPRQSRPVYELIIAALHACDYRSRKKDESSASKSTPRDEDLPYIPAWDEAQVRNSPGAYPLPSLAPRISVRKERCPHGVSHLNRCRDCD